MRSRLPNLLVPCLVASWAACSSSSGPVASSGIGTWNITVNRMIFVSATITDTVLVRPAPFALVVQDTGAGSSGIFPHVYGLDPAGDTVIRWGLGNATSLSVTGDSMKIVFDNGAETCLLRITGTFHGTTASGTSGVSCADSAFTGGAWSATKS